MKIAEVTNMPPTPEQLRIQSLAATKDRAADALTAERQRQQVARAQKKLVKIKQSKPAVF
jgi:lipid II:glycine glycyltransferase (peptidoglycan interpeptide bridge formation enzyme)